MSRPVASRGQPECHVSTAQGLRAHLEARIVRQSGAIGPWGHRHGIHAILIARHWVRISVPGVCSVSVSHSGACCRTEIPHERRSGGAGGPFAIHDRPVGLDVDAIVLIAAGEGINTASVRRNGLVPLADGILPRLQLCSVWLQVWVIHYCLEPFASHVDLICCLYFFPAVSSSRGLNDRGLNVISIWDFRMRGMHIT